MGWRQAMVSAAACRTLATTLIKALRADRPNTDVLVLTAYDTPRLRTQMRALGVEHYLAKPVDLRELGHEVGLLMQQRTGSS